MAAKATVGLDPGAVLLLDGVQCTVTDADWLRQVFTFLRAGEGECFRLTLDQVQACTVSAVGRPLQAPSRLDLLREKDKEIVAGKLAHALEAATGYRSGTPDVALPREPRAEYDPDRVPAYQRRANKVRELAEDPDKAKYAMSAATLRRFAERHAAGDPDAAVDGRKARRRQHRRAMTTAAQRAAWTVIEQLKDQSTISMTSRYARICRLLSDAGVPEGEWPSPSTVERWHRDRFTPGQLRGKARTRNSATVAPRGGYRRRKLNRAGACVVLDSYSLDLLLKGTRWHGRVRGVLVIACDWYSRSVVALRVVETADTGQDVGFVCREISRPKPLRVDWPDEFRWAYVGVPEHVLLPAEGKHFAALPYVVPSDVTMDHGATYKNYDNVNLVAGMGSSILPARKGTGPDKPTVERFFGALKTMLLEHLENFRGSDVSERGRSVGERLEYSAAEFEDLLLRWVIAEWQNHEMTSVRPPWCPDEAGWSPNRLYEESIRQYGLPQPLITDDGYLSGLKTKQVKVSQAGVKVGPLVYDAPDLDPYRGQPNPVSRGRDDKRNTYEVRADKRDRRSVWFWHPLLERWIRLDWTGGDRAELPVFGEEHVLKLSRHLKKSALQVVHQRDLVPVLLYDVMGLNRPATEGRAAQDDSRTRRNADLAARDADIHGLPSAAAASIQDTVEGDTAVEDQPAAKAREAVRGARADRRRRGMTVVPADLSPATATATATAPVATPRAAPLGASLIDPLARPARRSPGTQEDQ